jgi:hypothetical protein
MALLESNDPTPIMPRSRRWVFAALLSLAISICAVIIVVSHPTTPAISRLSRVAESFASPGEFLWWATLGGAFSGYPSGVSGYSLWVLGTALFWFLSAAPFIALVPRLLAWRQPKG